MRRRNALLIGGGVLAALLGVPGLWTLYTSMTFPSERTPEGAYLRIALAIGRSRLGDCLAYLEADAQAAVHTIHQFTQKSLVLVRASFPEAEKRAWFANHPEAEQGKTPEDLWVVLAHDHHWEARLRADLSGIRSVETSGDRATVVTVNGTRYPFRHSPDGLWGLTLFTAVLVQQKQKAARDFALLEQSAKDYERAAHAH